MHLWSSTKIETDTHMIRNHPHNLSRICKRIKIYGEEEKLRQVPHGLPEIIKDRAPLCAHRQRAPSLRTRRPTPCHMFIGGASQAETPLRREVVLWSLVAPHLLLLLPRRRQLGEALVAPRILLARRWPWSPLCASPPPCSSSHLEDGDQSRHFSSSPIAVGGLVEPPLHITSLPVSGGSRTTTWWSRPYAGPPPGSTAAIRGRRPGGA